MRASQIVLGTANFGLQYGVKNKRQLSISAVESILEYCRSASVCALDTAIGYGESQRVLGDLGSHDFELITKLPSLPPQERNVLQWVRGQVSGALRDLKRDNLYGLLLHRPGELLESRGTELVEALREAQQEFNIQKVGVSVYEPQELLDCWQVFHYDLVQLPCNVFDQRFTSSPIIDHLQSRKIEVHARSVFLQGLLLMPESSRPPYFGAWANVFDEWSAFVTGCKKTPLEVCLAFASQQHFVGKWVIGVDSKDQLLSILNISESGEVETPADAWGSFADLPLELISPARWGLQ